MINLKCNFIFVLLLSSSFICSSKIFINGESHACHNPDGQLGKCTSRESCHNYTNCNRTASVFECLNGHGKRPFVCCIYGSRIVFPDDEETPAEDDSVTTRNVVTAPGTSPILFPDEDGKYNIPSSNKTPSTFRSAVQPHVFVAKAVDLFPKPWVCGPLKLKHQIYNGHEAELGEFPWLVNLEYLTDDDLVIACAGNIINHRFVLTAAHCVTGNVEKEVGKLVSLRAGEHNTQMDIDCDKSNFCLPPFQRFNVIRSIVHEKYRITRRNKTFNDIALLKTDRKMIYSDSIRPICLPDIMIPMPTLTNRTTLTVAGWGADVNVTYTHEKRIVDLRYVEVCPLKVKPAQMCAGGSNGKDSCTGDSGASLCRKTQRGWLVEGIVSYGRSCGTDKPGVYTRVRSFLEWIHANVDEN